MISMFWRRIISALMLGVGVALILRNLMNLVSQIREKKRKEDEDAESE